MKKILLLLNSLFILSSGNAYSMEKWEAQAENDVKALIAYAEELGAQDLAFARLYYTLSADTALLKFGIGTPNYIKVRDIFYEWYKSEENNNSSNLDAFWKEFKKRDAKYVGVTVPLFYLQAALYKQLFNTLAKDGKVTLKYGPLKDTVLTSSEFSFPE